MRPTSGRRGLQSNNPLVLRSTGTFWHDRLEGCRQSYDLLTTPDRVLHQRSRPLTRAQTGKAGWIMAPPLARSRRQAPLGAH